MKKAFTIILLAIYVTLSVGMTIIVHTCGGESQTIIAVSSIEDPCGCNDAVSSDVLDKCCTTELKSAKIDDAQKISSATITEKLTVLGQVSVPVFSLLQNDDSHHSFEFTPYVSPPPNTDIIIVNSVFLI
jgi:hypothetical protein